MNKLIIPIKGMHCRSCELLIAEELEAVAGVERASASFKKGEAVVQFQGKKPVFDEMRAAIENAGYTVGSKQQLGWFSRNAKDYVMLFNALALVLVLFIVGDMSGLFALQVTSGNTSLLIVPVVGLVAGFSTCMALIGGLVLALSARHNELHPEATAMQKFRPHIFFNLGRIIGFAVLGSLLGLFGSAFKLSPTVLSLLTIAVGVVMVVLGLKLVEIFPKLKTISLSLPSGIAKLLGIKKEAKEYSHRGAVIAGSLSFFLPCGFTQSMQLLAIASGSPLQGAFIMSLFALGTAPGLLGIGGLASAFRGKFAKLFFMSAGVVVIALGVFNIKNASSVLFVRSAAVAPISQPDASPAQEVRMTQSAFGYTPNSFTVKAGQKVRWKINSTSSYSCASTILMKSFGINKNLMPGENIVEFTPTKPGKYAFSCSMGMYRGEFIVEAN